jgi:hypothetical protein
MQGKILEIEFLILADTFLMVSVNMQAEILEETRSNRAAVTAISSRRNLRRLLLKIVR